MSWESLVLLEVVGRHLLLHLAVVLHYLLDRRSTDRSVDFPTDPSLLLAAQQQELRIG